MTDRLMPRPLKLGQHSNTPVISPFYNWRDAELDPLGRRMIMGYVIPDWQRDLVWTEDQKTRLVENLWLGIGIGTYTVNRSQTFDPRYDNLLIDGQQRMSALEDYFADRLKIFGYLWSEITDIDRRGFLSGRTFASYELATNDEAELRNYYNLMNFAGTAHRDGEQA